MSSRRHSHIIDVGRGDGDMRNSSGDGDMRNSSGDGDTTL